MSGSPLVAVWPAAWRPSRGDLALALLLGLFALQGASDADGVKDPAWAVIGLIECTALPLAFRSLWPLPVLGVTLAAAVAGDLLFDGLAARRAGDRAVLGRAPSRAPRLPDGRRRRRGWTRRSRGVACRREPAVRDRDLCGARGGVAIGDNVRRRH